MEKKFINNDLIETDQELQQLFKEHKEKVQDQVKNQGDLIQMKLDTQKKIKKLTDQKNDKLTTVGRLTSENEVKIFLIINFFLF